MSKQNKLLILIGIVVMFGLFKNIMGNGVADEKLKTAVQQGAKLVDVRSPGEFASGSVPDAINIPLDKIMVEYKRLKSTDTIVVFCRSGNRSAQAKHILEQQGFKNVLNGGTWQNVNSLK